MKFLSKDVNQRIQRGALVVAVAAIIAGCSAAPKTIPELETARAIVPQVEASPRAGIAAANISEARKSLDRAEKLAQKGNLDDVKYEADIANRHAQIANEKILTAQAREQLEQGKADQQKVLLEARNREALQAQQRAQMANRRADSLEEELKGLQAKKTERGLVLTLGDVLFDSGKATLKSGAYGTIDRLASALKEVTSRKVAIEGHTDSMGSDEFNQELSQQRALAVQSALVQRGVNGSQITAAGKGEGFPVATNDSSSGRQQNRRVEMIFTEDSSQVASDSN